MGVQTPRLTHLQTLIFFFSEPLRQVPIMFQLSRIQGSEESTSYFCTSIVRTSFWASRMFSSKILMKRSVATARRQQERPFIIAQEMSLMVLVYFILGAVIFYKGLVRLRLKLTKAIVLVLSKDYYSIQAPLLYTFIPFTTFLRELYKFLHPTAIIDYSSFTRFLLQDRQLKPNSFTCILYWNPHSFSFSGSGAVSTFKQPQLEAIARHSP